MALIPTLFLIVMAFKGGHTSGIQQRYSGFSFPYVIILISLLLQYVSEHQSRIQISDLRLPCDSILFCGTTIEGIL